MTTPSKVDTLAGPSSRREERKVLAGTLVGTTIEWYDFFIFAQLTATLLSPLFLAPLNQSNPGLAQILSFALIGISFLFRPLAPWWPGTWATAWDARQCSSSPW